MTRFRRESAWAYLFIAPPIIGFALFALGPVIASLVLSFTRYDVLTPPKAVGLDNYRRLFTDDWFVGKSLLNTAFYLLGVPIGMALALALAWLLDRTTRFRAFFRTVYFVPSVCSGVAIALLWGWIYRSDYGLLDLVLHAIGIHHTPAWLANPHLVKPSLIGMQVWAGLGFDVIVFLAALKSVPKHLLEAAELDGANAWQRFRHVTFPAISPTVFFVSVTSTIGALQSFDQIFVMTRGGPSFSSATYMLYVYLRGFQYFDMGYACAMAWLLGAVILVVTWLQFRVARVWVHDE